MTVSGIIVDVKKKNMFHGTICVENGKIDSINPYFKAESTQDEVLPYIIPGFIDSHIHLEMTQISPFEYAKAAFSQGVVGAVADLHDVSGVLGLSGILKLIENSKQSPFHFGFSAPANLKKGVYGLQDVEELLKMPEVTHLGEIYDFPAVILHEKIAELLFDLAKKYGKPVDGYAPGVARNHLDEYVKSLVSTDCGCHTFEEACEKIKRGLKIHLKIRDEIEFQNLCDLLIQHSDSVMFGSEMVYGFNIANAEHGYINKAVSYAVKKGCDLYSVLKAACLNAAEHYKLPVGTLSVGDNADFVLVDSLFEFNVLKTFVNGECVYDNPELKRSGVYNDLSSVKKSSARLEAQNSFAAKKISVDDIKIFTKDVTLDSELVNAIDVQLDEICTSRKRLELPIASKITGEISSCIEKDCVKAVLVSRNGDFAPVPFFVKGFGMKKGAYAMSISHEDHDIVAIGVDDNDIVCAVNSVIDMRGGISYAMDGTILLNIQLDFAGLLSSKSYEDFCEQFKDVHDIVRNQMKVTIAHPLRCLSYIADTNISNLKISKDGLFNVVTQQVIPVVLN